MAGKTPRNSPYSDGFDLRHRLKLTQEGKDEDLCPKHEVFAAGGPQGSIKLFKMDTLLYCGDFKAHEKKITGLEFCHVNDHCFWTSSADSTLRYWDTRKSFNTAVYRILSSNNCPFTACGLNCSDEIVAAATEPYGEDYAFAIIFVTYNKYDKPVMSNKSAELINKDELRSYCLKVNGAWEGIIRAGGGIHGNPASCHDQRQGGCAIGQQTTKTTQSIREELPAKPWVAFKSVRRATADQHCFDFNHS
ncbi:hypothetical protein P5673_017683 [Acropora cervicornis]|uniref:WD repeat-containing protein 89 n=1 Tax=Acropora cervicornis TaxID=6130 RepID=A0AAD9QE44_ACRCE|nr:hypothetical protein P5673_017683 [Acropora cervicornis]